MTGTVPPRDEAAPVTDGLALVFPENAGEPVSLPPRRRRSHQPHASSSRPGTRGSGGSRSTAGSRAEARPGRRSPRSPRRRRALRRLSAALVVLVGLPLLAGALVQLGWRSGVTTFEADPFPSGSRPAPPADGALNVLLIGSDSRDGDLDPVDEAGPTGQRSDTMMLVNVSGDRREVTVVSIMRDLWVDVPGHGEAKVNAAYAWGGAPLLVQTVEQLLDTRVAHVALVDFEGFASMSTALGGVEVDSPVAFSSRNVPGHDFAAGPNVVAGERALAFVRERYAFADADHQRVRNQQAFLRGVVDGLLRDGLADPGRLASFVSTTTRWVTVDAGLGPAETTRLGYELRGVRADDVAFFTLPTAGGGVRGGGQSVVLPDEAATTAVSAAIADDDLRRWSDAADLTPERP
ncbi:LytR family transcriptional regulator [Frigoribacterium sp. NBH87]|uniref:LCP family protein n=1 Tax=Frigoribacterium sp. NBH87 TaxID=2596916 RepID=UPI001623DBB7|nr:LCP family protein [Frigoribacterium sp. NBH87]QNE43425.1 LytR family transcriptional regulator [Frigoribacterium sp. NBH87]